MTRHTIGPRLLRTVAWLALAGASMSGCASRRATAADTAFQEAPRQQTFTGRVTRDVALPYTIFFPHSYTSSGEPAPLLLFLHGMGERGTDFSKLMIHGPLKHFDRDTFPFILVSPLLPDSQVWDAHVLLALLDDLEQRYNIDRTREYVTGLSMGGFGTWDLVATAPHRFAAALPIAGGGNPVAACQLRDTPVWAFHGALDTAIPPAQTEEMVEWLRNCGGKVRLTLYPDATHNAWARTFADPEVWKWVLAQRRTR
jgi:predicted peptidase